MQSKERKGKRRTAANIGDRQCWKLTEGVLKERQAVCAYLRSGERRRQRRPHVAVTKEQEEGEKKSS